MSAAGEARGELRCASERYSEGRDSAQHAQRVFSGSLVQLGEVSELSKQASGIVNGAIESIQAAIASLGEVITIADAGRRAGAAIQEKGSNAGRETLHARNCAFSGLSALRTAVGEDVAEAVGRKAFARSDTGFSRAVALEGQGEALAAGFFIGGARTEEFVYRLGKLVSGFESLATEFPSGEEGEKIVNQGTQETEEALGGFNSAIEYIDSKMSAL